MDTHEVRKILTVFIASPGDVADERHITKCIVDEINSQFRGIGWHVDLRGWEDVPPGYGRPQELINPDVEACQLFVGVIWRRWGSDTGEFSSGFEEEYRLALARRANSSLPEICMFLKEIEKAQSEDPGRQLKKVLNFRKELKKEKFLMYKEFATPDQYGTMLRDVLIRQLLRLAKIDEQLALAGPSSTPSDSCPGSAERSALLQGPEQVQPAIRQLTETLEFAIAYIRSEAPKVERNQANPLNDFQITRLHLTTSMMMELRNRGSLLGIHEINLLFRHRISLHPMWQESLYLLRTIIEDDHEVKPGWFWFDGMEGSHVLNILFTISTNDHNLDVRHKTLSLLANAQVELPLDRSNREAYIRILLKEEEMRVRIAGLRLLSETGQLGDVPILLALIEKEADGERRSELTRVWLSILARHDSRESIREMLGSEEFTQHAQFVIPYLRHHADQIPSEQLAAVLGRDNSAILELAVTELLRRGELTESCLKLLQKNPSKAIKEIVLREMVRRGLEVDFEEVDSVESLRSSLEFEKYKSWGPEALLEKLDWFSSEGRAAYQALARHHFEQFSDRLRRDLRDGYATLKQDSQERMRRQFQGEDPKAIDNVIRRWDEDKLNEYMVQSYIVVAMDILASFGDAGDADLGRHYLGHEGTMQNEIRLNAARLLVRVGTHNDADLIVDALGDCYGETKLQLAKHALELAPGISGIAPRLLSLSDEKLTPLGIGSLLSEDSPDLRKTLEAKLLDKNAMIRLAAVAFFYRIYSALELRDLLDRYTGSHYYYYNVVTALDKLLYAPHFLRNWYEAEFTKIVTSQEN